MSGAHVGNDVKAKVCGLRRWQHGATALRCGADYFGLVFAGRVRQVTPECARELVLHLGPMQAVGVFVDAGSERIRRHRDIADFPIVQLHGSEPPEMCRALKQDGLDVWKAVRPTSRRELARHWNTYAPVVDAILVEGFSPRAPGGTGTAIEYDWLDEVDRSACPLVLAGGLNAGNVGDAIRAVRPDIVDVSSGVERAPGEKSRELIFDFLAAVRDAPPAPLMPPVELSFEEWDGGGRVGA